MEKIAIIKKWSEYIEELFQDDREINPEICKSMDGLKVLELEVRDTIHKIKNNKAKGPNDVVIEMVQALDNFGNKMLTKIANAIYGTGKIPEDL